MIRDKKGGFNMTIKEIKDKKNELKKDIEKLLNTFTQETELPVEGLEICETANTLMGTNRIYFVDVMVRI
jgi:hypothetical protein